jgi:RNA polymerase sigma-70 factor, ECF subfamily
VIGRRDPLEYPEDLIRRVYSYVAYRIGDGPDAEDVTGDVFERAIRYRTSFDGSKGSPLGWLIGIARRCILEFAAAATTAPVPEVPEQGDLEADALRRLVVRDAVASLSEPDRDLIALRFGADLTARQIAELFDVKTNAIEVRLHRALGRLRDELRSAGESGPDTRPVRNPALEQ